MRACEESHNGRAYHASVLPLHATFCSSRMNISSTKHAVNMRRFYFDAAHRAYLLILVAFAAISLVDAQSVSLSLLDFRAGATSVTVTGRLTPTTYVPPFSVLTITISGTFPSGNFDSPADVVTSCALLGL